MAKINLKSNEIGGGRPKSQGSNRSLIMGITTLSLGLLAFGVVRYLNIQAEAKNEETRAEIVQLEERLNNPEVKKLYDFQDRLIEIEGLMQNKTMQNAVLEKIARYTLPGTRFTKLEFENQIGKTEVDATFIIQNHNELAKQIEAFSLIGDEVETVLLDSSKVDQEGLGIDGNLIFSIKEAK
jgi:hypothetical protein